MLFGLMTGASDGEQENPVHERRWKSLFIALDACVPEHKTEEVREEVRSETEGIWTDVGVMIFGKVLSRSLNWDWASSSICSHSANEATIPKTSFSGQRYSIEADVIAARQKLSTRNPC